jgi:glucoamylase
VTNDGVLLPEIKRHYMRIRPPECGEAYACEGCGIGDHPLPTGRPARAPSLRRAKSSMPDSLSWCATACARPRSAHGGPLKVVDAVLKRDLPQGSGWLRYNWDGYGQRPDGGPFQGWGQGRVWPLLTGERAHYELAAGKGHPRTDRDLRALCHLRPDDARAGVG